MRDIIGEIISLLERIYNEDASRHTTLRDPRWSYYGPRAALSSHPATVYAYSTKAVEGAYWSWIYQWRPKTKTWETTRLVKHRLRRTAKARALQLFTDSTRA